MKVIQLDEEEQDSLDAFESGELQSNLTPARREFIEQSAVQTLKWDKEVNVQISERDHTALQRRAAEEGIPYQTLIASILHKYASGSLYDLTANKTVHS